MCLLEVADHTSKYGCGHVYVLQIVRCLEATYRVNQALCVYPKTKFMAPDSGAFRDLMRFFRAGHAKLAGPCPHCQKMGWPNFY